MEKLKVQITGPELDRAMMDAWLRATGQVSVIPVSGARNKGGAADLVSLLVCDRPGWLERACGDHVNRLGADADNAPCAHVVMLTHGDVELVRLAASRGIGVFVSHDDPAESLLEALKHAARGERYTTPGVSAVVTSIIQEALSARRPSVPDAAKTALSLQERSVAVLAAAGWSNGAIAERLCVSLPTVKSHLHRLYRKLSINKCSQILHAVQDDHRMLAEVEEAARATPARQKL